jgi:hypothetical protein
MDPDDIVEGSVGEADSSDVTLVSLNKPIWVYGLRNPGWLLPPRDGHAHKIALVALGCTRSNPGPQPEDDRGRFARAVPLFLAETCWFMTGLQPISIIPVVKGSGAAMRDSEMPESEVWDLGGQGMRYVVTGVLDENGLECELSLTLYDAAAQTRIERFTRKFQRFEFGKTVLELEGQLRAALGGSEQPALPWYRLPEVGVIDGYLGALARALTLYLAQKKVLPRDQLAGEPNLLQWIADFAVATHGMPVPPVLLAASLAVDRGMGSTIFQEFKAQTVALMARESNPEAPFYRMAPLLYQLFGMDDLYAERCAELLEIGDSALISWLEALEASYKN